jgi:hypothetical protein
MYRFQRMLGIVLMVVAPVALASCRSPSDNVPAQGTPELYFTDPDGLLVQLQDVKYCGGGDVLGDVCS